MLRLGVFLSLKAALKVFSKVLRHLDIEELELLTDGQVLDHVVLYQHLKSEAEDGSQEKAAAYGTVGLGLRGRINLEVAVQVVHALSTRALHHLLGEDEDL